ncbi:hypothetical protein, partial [Undibacterium sp. 10I3]|uniref:hypothetical protein n=1 Tax=Undibacterium sp. 10I3 TaxID=3048579 RepID=UPI002B23CEEB
LTSSSPSPSLPIAIAIVCSLSDDRYCTLCFVQEEVALPPLLVLLAVVRCVLGYLPDTYLAAVVCSFAW